MLNDELKAHARATKQRQAEQQLLEELHKVSE